MVKLICLRFLSSVFSLTIFRIALPPPHPLFTSFYLLTYNHGHNSLVKALFASITQQNSERNSLPPILIFLLSDPLRNMPKNNIDS